MGIIIHSLESVSFKDLYAAFSSAFKDYDFSLNADELRRMLDRRGYNPQLSFGVFFEGRLISFVFNGTGMYNNILTAYDTGTGTVPSFRGLHLTQKIFTFSLELICQQGVRQYVLEVLQHNHKAIKIYRKLGFETQRNFNYYSAKLSDIVPVLQVNHTACRILPSDLKTALTKRPGSIFILHGKMTGLHWNAESTIWTYWELMKEKNLSDLLSLNRHLAIFHPSQLQKITGVKE